MMPLADILFLAVLIYFLYRFVSNFLLPVVRATRQVRQQFRNMQGPANDAGSTSRPRSAGPGNSRPGPGSSQRPFSADRPQPGQAANKRSTKPPAEDYIDFEEIK